jgi:hypothetical protein
VWAEFLQEVAELLTLDGVEEQSSHVGRG